MGVRKPNTRDGVAPKAPKSYARIPPTVGRAYERFLELPVALMLAVMWLVGAALLGSGVLVVYLAGRVLVRAVVGKH